MITDTTVSACKVRGVLLFEMRHIEDKVRGNLTVGQFAWDMPFVPQRYFITYDIPTAQTRGEHAHRQCAQFMLCVSGGCSVIVDDGRNHEEFRLDRPTRAIYVPPMVWAAEFKHTPDSALMVFASRPYEPEDYVRNYDEFLSLTHGRTPPDPLP